MKRKQRTRHTLLRLEDRLASGNLTLRWLVSDDVIPLRATLVTGHLLDRLSNYFVGISPMGISLQIISLQGRL